MSDKEATSPPNTENNEFYFESDHLALKNNEDYGKLLGTIVTLEAQRVQAIEDLNKLIAMRTEALKDPISFVKKLQDGTLPDLPGPQKIADIHCIDWSQYNTAIPDIRLRPQTRRGHKFPQTDSKNIQEPGKVLVRGRVFDESKPETFNQLWTASEQMRLEQLLEEYPPETVEMRRWTKISNALGNRTPKQVSSRVQKYFIKLRKTDFTEDPKLKMDAKKRNYRQRSNNHLYRHSTFFPRQNMMRDLLEETNEQSVAQEPQMDVNEENNDDSFQFNQIDVLRQIKTEKEEYPSFVHKHIGYKCAMCDEEPLLGTRWHCAECQNKIDFCSDCAIRQFELEEPIHNPSHKLIPIKPPQNTDDYDADYLAQSFNNSSYNYLDPNFVPGDRISSR